VNEKIRELIKKDKQIMGMIHTGYAVEDIIDTLTIVDTTMDKIND